MRNTCIVGLITILIAACNADVSDRSEAFTGVVESSPRVVLPTVERDSNGVERLTFTADDLSRVPRFTLDSAPLAIAGGANGSGEFDLTYAREVQLLSDNRLVAFASIGARLLVFSADGAEERIIGRVGKGPGEFTAPGGVVVLPGDTLFLTDVPNNRLNWVMPDGRFVRTAPLGWERLTGYTQNLVGVLSDGRVILHSAGWILSSPDTLARGTASVVVQPMQGKALDIARVPDLEQTSVTVRLRGRDERYGVVRRYTPRAHIVVWDSLITTTSGESYCITMRSPSGAVVRELSIPLQRRPVSEAMTQRALNKDLQRIDLQKSEGGGDTYTKDELKRIARLTPASDSVPLLVGMYTSPDGTLWVLDNAAASGAEGTVATAFRKDGAMLGRVSLGVGALPMAFGTDRVVLRVTDEDDLVALRVHRIVR